MTWSRGAGHLASDRSPAPIVAHGNAPPSLLGYKKNAEASGSGGGWYYDAEPVGGATPTKIHLCPFDVREREAGTGTAKVDILLGCKTIVK